MSLSEARARSLAHRLGIVGQRRWVVAAIVTIAAVAAPWSLVAGCGAQSIAERTNELQARFDALAPGGYIKLEPITYQHSDMLVVRVPGVRIDGNGATLQATNDVASAVKLEADGIQLSNVNLAAPLQGQRYTGMNQHKLVIAGNGISVSHVSLHGSAAAGIFVYGAHDFRIDDVNIFATRADGIHMTRGSSRGVVTNVHTDQTGDDGIAVVSYQDDPTESSDIQINGVNVASTRWGRGISVVGGRNVTVRGFSVANTNSAGLYVASEGAPFFTRPVQSVSIADGNVTNANTNPDIVQGAVLVATATPGSPVRDVQINNVTVSDTPASAQKDVALTAKGSPVERIRLDDIHIIGSSVEPFYTDVPKSSYQTSGWTLDGQPISVQ